MSLPLSDDVHNALARFATSVEAHYGVRLHGLWLYGSRARGDHRPDSDVDIAVVLEEPTSSFSEIRDLSNLVYPIELDTGFFFQTVPVWRKEWESGRRPLVAEMRRDGKAIGEVTPRVSLMPGHDEPDRTKPLDAADRALASAHWLLAARDKAGAAERASFSTRHAARAVLLARGIRFARIKSHDALASVFADVIVAPGHMAASLADTAFEAERIHLAIDDPDAAEATPSIARVAAVINAVAPFNAACRALVPPPASDAPSQA